MSRDQESCSFLCINGQRPNVDDIVDVIVKLDTCEADVAAGHTESLSCASTNSLPAVVLNAYRGTSITRRVRRRGVEGLRIGVEVWRLGVEGRDVEPLYARGSSSQQLYASRGRGCSVEGSRGNVELFA